MPDTTIPREQENLFTVVRGILTEQFGVTDDRVTPDTNIQTEFGCDSLDAIELIMEVEDRFEVAIPDEEAQKLTTARAIVNWLYDHGER